MQTARWLSQRLVRAVAAAAFLVVVSGTATSALAAPRAVWIDTDPAVGEKDRDVDDGLALVQAFHSPELVIRGVSVVFGNAPLAAAGPITHRLVERFGPPGLGVFTGAAGASDRGKPTAATDALAAALKRERLGILLLGPATNLATLLQREPALAARIEVVVAVAGRQPGQRFTTGTMNHRGHRDFNFEEDPPAFQVLLDSGVPLVLTPFEISSAVWLTAADLQQLRSGGEAGRALATPAGHWLQLWQNVFQVQGFNPFDTLAVGYLTNPAWFHCSDLPVRIEQLTDDVTEQRMQGVRVATKPYLLASPALPKTARVVHYCATVDAAFKGDLMRRLTMK